VPDVRKVYGDWQSRQTVEREKKGLQDQISDLQKQLKSALPRPTSGVVVAPAHDPNGPHNMRESFNKLKEDPDFLRLIYQNNA